MQKVLHIVNSVKKRGSIVAVALAVVTSTIGFGALNAQNASADYVGQSCNASVDGTWWQSRALDFAPGNWCAIKGDNKAVFQSDGNLVVYKGNVATWSSKTGGRASTGHLALQNDGNVVIYNGANQALWTTNTDGNYNTRMSLVVQSDNNLVVYRNYTQAVWAKN